jgi:hypothetical protein
MFASVPRAQPLSLAVATQLWLRPQLQATRSINFIFLGKNVQIFAKMSETEQKDLATAEELKGVKRAAEVSKVLPPEIVI